MSKGAELPFPKGILWGTATSAHQIEGNNKNSDWWDWETNKPERRKYPLEPSGIACDSYNRYEEDFDLCKRLNNNVVRISIEWARIEPEQGKFDKKEIEHYRQVLKAAKDRGLKTFATLHHFTNPLWFSKKGGWTRFDSPKLFAKYAEVCAREFSDLVDFFITINEPEVLVGAGFLAGFFYPGKHNLVLATLAEINLYRAHNAAYDAIKDLTETPTGIVKNIQWFDTDEKKSMFLDKWIARLTIFLLCDLFMFLIKGRLDFLGLNYYFTNRFVWLRKRNANDRVSDLGWWIHPEGLENVLLRLKKYKVPIYITENGLADADDSKRTEFIHDHLVAAWNAIQAGTDLRGYMHWSLLDNYEWHEGYRPQFGLVEIDRENNLQRKPRPSFHYYADICKNNRVVKGSYDKKSAQKNSLV